MNENTHGRLRFDSTTLRTLLGQNEINDKLI